MISEVLKEKLVHMKAAGQYLDSITFAGNGEPTLHPLFPDILNDVITLRDDYYPGALVSVLSNATMTDDEKIFSALLRADQNILKLDSAREETLRSINCPAANVSISKIIEQLVSFRGKLTIQTLFFRGIHNGAAIDNTTEDELVAWIGALKRIRPQNVMIYTIARDTAVEGLESVSHDELMSIAARAGREGISIQVSS